jgi:hypothetical protein
MILKRDESGRFLPGIAAPLTPDERTDIVRRYVELKESKHAIARVYRRSQRKIRRVLIDAGIPNRSGGKKDCDKRKVTRQQKVVVVRSAPKVRRIHYAPSSPIPLRTCCSSIVRAGERCFCQQPIRVLEHMPVLVRGDMGLLLPKRRVSV